MKLVSELTEKELKEIKEVLDKDGIIIFPTDTVYGIGCNCYSEKALKKLYSFKDRPLSKPINVLADSKEKIETVCREIYRAGEVIFSDKALEQIKQFRC